jgi:hypothetical protein
MMRERLVSSGVMALVRERITQRQATEWLMDHVEIVEKSTTPVVDGAPEVKPKKKGTSTKKPAKKKTAEAKED